MGTKTTKDYSIALDALLDGDASVADLTRSLFYFNYKQTLRTDPRLAEMMKACAIPGRFNSEVIGILRGKPGDYRTNKRLLSGLTQFNFVLTRKDGHFVYHDNTRDILLREWHS